MHLLWPLASFNRFDKSKGERMSALIKEKSQLLVSRPGDRLFLFPCAEPMTKVIIGISLPDSILYSSYSCGTNIYYQKRQLFFCFFYQDLRVDLELHIHMFCKVCEIRLDAIIVLFCQAMLKVSD